MVELHTDYKKEFSEDEDVFNMPFKEAIKEMKRRKPTISDKIKDIEQKEKQNYFWIKKTVDLEVTKRIHSELLKNLQEGKSLNEFLKKVSEFNLPKSYLKGVYRTVTTQAQQRGHLDQQLKAVDLGFEYGIFYAILDGRQTKICNSLNNKVMKLKDFVDKGYYPPLHYMCRSHILQVDEQKLKKMNIKPLENVKPNENPFSDFTSDWDKKYKELYKKKEKEAKVIRKSIDKLANKGYNSIDKGIANTLVNYEKYANNWENKTLINYITNEDKEQFNLKMQSMFDKAKYNMRVPDNTLEKILNGDGYFKNQFETQTSKGTLNSEFRQKATKQLFGSDIKKLKNKDYEKYGYLGNENWLIDYKHNKNYPHNINQYGRTIVRFSKEKLKNKVTYTIDDSLGYAYKKLTVAGQPEHVSYNGVPLSYIKTIKSLIKTINSDITPENFTEIIRARYIELQYHGDIHLSDVSEICFTDKIPNDDVLNKLKQLGIKLFAIVGDDNIYEI